MARMLYRLGATSHRHRVAAVLLWVAMLLSAGVGAATLGGSTSDAISIPGQESTTALDRIGEELGTAGTATGRVVVQTPDGDTLMTPQNAAELAGLVSDLATLPGVLSAADPWSETAPAVSPDQATGYITITYDVPVDEVTAEQRDALTDVLDDARATGLAVEVTGDAVTEPVHVGGPAEAVGVVVALVVLAVTYGSLALAGMNLVTALIGVGAGVLGITIGTGFLELQSTTPILASMLGLAVGIDYALFIVTRFRQELNAGRAVGDAVARRSAPQGPLSSRPA